MYVKLDIHFEFFNVFELFLNEYQFLTNQKYLLFECKVQYFFLNVDGYLVDKLV